MGPRVRGDDSLLGAVHSPDDLGALRDQFIRSRLISCAHNSRRGPTSKTEARDVSPIKKAVWPIAKRDYMTGVCTMVREERSAPCSILALQRSR
jgi:hypothetical protein